MTGFAALKLNYWQSTCTTESCEIVEDVTIFTICGTGYCLLAIVLWIWGRLLELRLIASAGVENIDDYSIFLMTEFRTDETLSHCATSPVLAKDIISNFLKEKEIHEVETKEQQYVRRHTYLKRVTEEVQNRNSGDSLTVRIRRLTENGSDRQKPSAKHAVTLSRVVSEKAISRVVNGERRHDVPCVDMKKGWADYDTSDCVVTSFDEMDTTTERSTATEQTLNIHHSMEDADAKEEKEDNSPTEKADELCVKPLPKEKRVGWKQAASVGCVDSDSHVSAGSDRPPVAGKKVFDKKSIKRAPSMENKLLDRGMSMIVRRNKKNLLSMSNGGRRMSFLQRANKGKLVVMFNVAI
jgi:hypothetical protein